MQAQQENRLIGRGKENTKMLLGTDVNKVNELVYRVAKAYGAEIVDAYVWGPSEKYPDSCSMYYVIKYGFAEKKIRISDHSKQHKDAVGQTNLRSITVNEKTTYKNLERFVINSINQVKRGALYAAFDYIAECA